MQKYADFLYQTLFFFLFLVFVLLSFIKKNRTKIETNQIPLFIYRLIARFNFCFVINKLM